MIFLGPRLATLRRSVGHLTMDRQRRRAARFCEASLTGNNELMSDPYIAYALIVVGLLLIVAEVFLPSGGILSVLALAGIIVGVAMNFARDATEGFLTLVALF